MIIKKLTISIIILIAYTFGIIHGLYLPNTHEEILNSFIKYDSIILALSTLALAVFTYMYINLTSQLISYQYQPVVIVNLKRIIKSGNIPYIQYVIKNIGKGPAYNIKFSFKQDNTEEIANKEFFIKDIFKKGIKYLPPDQEINYLLDQEVKVNDYLAKPIDIYITYDDFKDESYKFKSVISLELIEYKYDARNVVAKLGEINATLKVKDL